MDLQHPGQQPSEDLKQVLFRLNFYRGEVVNLDVDLHFAFCSSEAPGTSVPASEATAPPAPKRRQATATQAAPPTAAPGPVIVHAEIHRAFGLGEQDEGMQ